MKKLLIIISAIFISINCYSQFSKGYNRTLSGCGYSSRVEWDYDFKTYECADKNTNDTIIMIDGEEYEMYVYPSARSYDNKNYWGNNPLYIPKWVKKMIYNDIVDGKTYTEFLISPNYRKYNGNYYNGLLPLYGYKIVLRSGANKITKTIIGKGGGYCSAKLGDFHLYFQLDCIRGNYKLDFNPDDNYEFNAVKDYLIENQNRLGIEIKSYSFRDYGDCSIYISYYMEDEWLDQANQLENFYKEKRIESINW